MFKKGINTIPFLTKKNSEKDILFMSHVNKGRRFGRFSQHRLALFRNLTKSVVEHEVIKTTLPKAKTLRGFVERLITLAKEDTQSRRRLVFARIQDKKTTQQLFDLGRRYLDRKGGYTRVLKCGFRQGDAAPMAYIELLPESN